MSSLHNPKISVIIPTFNRAESLKETLQDLLKQEENSFELIVVDNNSNDHTKTVVDSFESKYSGRLKYFFEGKQGKPWALNTGMQKASGEILVLTDDDCLFEKNWLRKVVSQMSEHNLDMLGGKVLAIFPEGKPDWIDLDISIYRGPMGHLDWGNEFYNNEKRSVHSAGANMIVTRKAYERYGGFPVMVRGEDTAMVVNWHRAGAKIAYSPEVVVYHKPSKKMLTRNYVRYWHFFYGRNNALIFLKGQVSSERNISGVPLWIYRRFISSILECLVALITFQKDSFVREISVHYYRGMICAMMEKQ